LLRRIFIRPSVPKNKIDW